MLYGQLALIAATLFSGAAVYITLAEQPARLTLEPAALLAEWQPAYAKGLRMQSSLAVVGFLFGLLTWWQTTDWRWLLGASILLLNWPYTLISMLPVNKQLMATTPSTAGTESRALVQQWGRLHAVRTMLGLLATAVFLWASLR
ncbi:DUF1772 domain-containing protein [Hymenobacter crusticola]|uniref:DUF1772 domain-containing protein n=1 Tax=Hymenobacter crusticola TaxID=1770526 RepID=A0A243W5Y5_9BACT|nr:DUF1772 domain-containing protein [Hymenobacter crusticola]OUJ68771.1 hypothetical protein BXP70_27445 [Hymenobacter crusticola]